jgi:hypothetical protein
VRVGLTQYRSIIVRRPPKRKGPPGENWVRSSSFETAQARLAEWGGVC